MNAMNIRFSNHALLATLTSLVLTLGAGSALAGGKATGSLPSITLKYDAIEASTPAGAEALYKRIRFAAARVCDRYDNPELARRIPWQRCQAQVVANAVAAVHQPVLTALHNRSAGEPRG